MIDKLKIKNFKSLRDISIKTTNLNLMMGLNSMGKSSVIQSMLLLRQSYEKFMLLTRLFLNGDLISLGNTKDVFFQNAGNDELLSFYLSDDEKYIETSYKYLNATDDSLESVKTNLSDLEANLISVFSEHFHYLDANHIPPAKTYSTINADKNTLNVLGNSGENAPYYLAKHGTEKIKLSTLHHYKAKSMTLAHELDAWMGEISPGTRIISQELPDIDLVKMAVQFETSTRTEHGTINEMSNEFAPINVGFGIPFVLPLILTILISEPGDLVLIENPESHLHPRGQAELGKLLALAAENGIQIFCETHSDHIINGARVAVKTKVISPEHIKLFYFGKKEDATLETKIQAINVDKNGELDQYPKGLLDEWGNLMSQLF